MSAPAQSGRVGDDFHEEQPQEIVVTADFVRELDVLSARRC
jgi:hypothetical protein